MLSIKQWCSEACSKPLELIIGLCVFFSVASGGVIENVASASLLILLITSLFYVRSWSQLWRLLSRDERLILFGFGLYFLSAVLSYYNVSDDHEYVKHLGRYLRFFLVVPIYLLLSRSDLKIFNYLLAGAVASGFVYILIAFASILERPGHAAQGGYHSITLGDMAMLNAMFMIAVLVSVGISKKLKVLLVVSIICLLYASVLSEARGAWLALPFCLSLLVLVAVRRGVVKIKAIFIALMISAALVMLTPAKEIVKNRWQVAVSEIELFQSGDEYLTSVGIRLAMWDSAVRVWKIHPIIGTGPGDFDLEMQSIEIKKIYERMPAYSSAHNNYFQALATTGAIGFITLCFALVMLPFRFFYRAYKEEPNSAALGGMVAITAFAVFGLTESWIIRSPVIAVYVMYFVVLATEVRKSIQSTDERR